MHLQRVLLTAQQIRSIPEKDRALMIVLAYALNEINALNKLLFLSTNFEHSPQWRVHAHISQAMLLMRTLVGKLNEIWLTIQGGYFGSKLSLLHNPTLGNSASKGLSNLGAYFGKKNLIHTVRNNFSFHYSLQHAANEIPESGPTEELAIYLHEQIGNSLYQFAEFAMGKALAESIDACNAEVAVDRLFSETSAVVEWLNDFGQGYLFSVLDMYVGAEVLRAGAERIEVGLVPASSDTTIPFFIDISKKPSDSSS
ncbi:MAG: hypothetical protein JWQ21_4011 [Herminiimonas sp.]|nr:hypothetical protein [Herminiimonas sp.]